MAVMAMPKAATVVPIARPMLVILKIISRSLFCGLYPVNTTSSVLLSDASLFRMIYSGLLSLIQVRHKPTFKAIL